MTTRIALKRLTSSDLTFFETLFRTLNAGNQKAINLNADVFINQLYPSLPTLVPTIGDRLAVSLTVLGPNGAGPYLISRSITKRAAYKNWRLNGEFVRDPESEPGRFSLLQSGDFAIMEFTGDPSPKEMTLLLLAKNSENDREIHALVAGLLPPGTRAMAPISREALATAAAVASPAHPIWALTNDPGLEAALEDAAKDGAAGVAALQRASGRPITPEEFAAAREAGERIGYNGEAIAWSLLERQQSDGTWASVEWRSKSNAVSAFDFLAVARDGTEVMIDAKSTAGQFGRVFHMSLAELKAACAGRYDVWRLYEVTDDGAKLRIAENVGPVAQRALNGLNPPRGITVDSMSIDPNLLEWSDERLIPFEDEP